MQGDETEFNSVPATDTAAQAGPQPTCSVAIPGIRLGKHLGEGGMATVYEGFDQGFSPERHVAVKLMDAAIGSDPDFRKRFAREAAVVAGFRHDNIVRVYTSGEIEGTKFIVMEYLSGGTLAARLQSGPLPLAEALHAAAELADALAYSHAREIIHRDFKPGNVLFTADGKPVLSDFGIAKNLSVEESGLTRHALVLGAPRYMSPEQGLAEAVTDRTDVYSLGLTLLEMLAGTLPPIALRVQRNPADVSALRALIPLAPVSIVDLIARCLHYDPGSRPSADECRLELEAALSAHNHPRPPPKNMSQWRTVGYGVGLAIAAFLAVVAYTRFDGIAAPSGSAPARIPSTTAPQALMFIQRSPPSVKIYLDGTEVAGERIAVKPGVHELVAIAAGFHGEVRRFTQPDDVAQNAQSFDLRPVRLPNEVEYALFLDLEEAKTLSASDVERVTEHTLQSALRSKLLYQGEQQAALDELDRDLELLARYGDARAPVVTFLAKSMRAGAMSGSLITKELTAASERGDAMASFFLAHAQREALTGTTAVSSSNAAYRAYCERLTRAAAQGWQSVAAKQRQLDSCD